MNIASQKNFIALYHMGIYADKKLLNWFMTEYPKYVTGKPDMGKSCIRFKKMNADDWIALYERAFKKK